MGLALAQSLYTIADYLLLERAAEERHKYLDGYVYKMAGESEKHGRICMNLAGLLHPQLRGTPCEGRVASTKVRSGPLPLSPQCSKGLLSYQDFFVVCDPIKNNDKYRDIVINPVVNCEVLSPPTVEFDCGTKFQRYDHWNPSLQDYLLEAESAPKIEHYTSQADSRQRYRVCRRLETCFAIESINCRLSPAEVYERPSFPPPPMPKLQVVPNKSSRAAKRPTATASPRRN